MICTIDMRDVFFHVEVDEKSEKFLSFITPKGQWEFNFFPFEFCNSLPVISELVAYIFRTFIQSKKMQIYIDDGIIMAKNKEEAFSILQEVLEHAAKYSIKSK